MVTWFITFGTTGKVTRITFGTFVKNDAIIDTAVILMVGTSK